MPMPPMIVHAQHAGLAATLHRLAEGRDQQAWTELLDTVGADIHRLARRLLGRSDLADDALQETLLQLRDHAGRFRTDEAEPDEAARRWVLRITGNVSLQLLRARRRAALRDRTAGESEARAAVPQAGPHDELERREGLDALRCALSELPEASRAALVLHYLAGLGFSEVAAELRVPVGTAKTRVHRALIALRGRLRPMAGAWSVSQLPQHLNDMTAPPPVPLSSHLHALLEAPTRATLSALPTTGTISMTMKIALACTATLTIAALPTLLSQESAPAADSVETAQRPGVREATTLLAPMPDILKQRLSVTFDGTGMSAPDYLRSIAAKFDLPLTCADGIAENSPFSLDVKDMRMADALTWMTRFSGAAWTWADGSVRISPRLGDGMAHHGVVDEDAAWRKAVDAQLDQEVTLDFPDTGLKDITSFLTRITGLNMVIDPVAMAAAPPPVSLKVDHMKLRFVMTFIAKSCGLAWDLSDGAVYWHEPTAQAREASIVGKRKADNDTDAPWRKALDDRLEQQLTFTFQEQSFQDVVSFLRQVTGVNIVVLPEVSANGGPAVVSLAMQDAPLRTVFDRIMELSHLRYDIEHQAIVISPLRKVVTAGAAAAVNGDAGTTVPPAPAPDAGSADGSRGAKREF
jgi:RNA polymerase sigma-70 factor, ECF subfamily